MGIREQLAKVGPLPITIAALAAIALGVFVAYRTFLADRTAPLPDPVVLICTECGAVLNTTAGDAMRRNTVDEFNPITPGLHCDKCGKNAMAFAWECPTDKTRFFRNPSLAPPKGVNYPATNRATDRPGTCPACGWDPAAEIRARTEAVIRQNSRPRQ